MIHFIVLLYIVTRLNALYAVHLQLVIYVYYVKLNMLACHYHRYANKKNTYIFGTIYPPCALDVTLLDYKVRVSL